MSWPQKIFTYDPSNKSHTFAGRAPLLITLVLIFAALVTATISGFVGMAGGMALLGVMSALMAPAEVVPLHGIVQLASNFTRTLVFLRHVAWRIFLVYALPLSLGVWLAAQIWSGDRLDWFKPVVGLFILLFLLWRRFSPRLRNVPLWSYAPLGAVVGFATIFVGATGPLIAPFFLRDDMNKEQIIATKAVCQSWGHTLKIPAFLTLGFDYLTHWQLLVALLLAVMVGTLIGKRLLGRMSRGVFDIIYQSILALISLYLIISGLTWVERRQAMRHG
ncbi:MAG: sulfite exporter TauE/SafE family protein, partial [Candidatus Zixiibacteriota bacterium]